MSTTRRRAAAPCRELSCVEADPLLLSPHGARSEGRDSGVGSPAFCAVADAHMHRCTYMLMTHRVFDGAIKCKLNGRRDGLGVGGRWRCVRRGVRAIYLRSGHRGSVARRATLDGGTGRGHGLCLWAVGTVHAEHGRETGQTLALSHRPCCEQITCGELPAARGGKLWFGQFGSKSSKHAPDGGRGRGSCVVAF